MKELIVIGSGTFAQIAKVYFEEYAGVRINRFAVSKELLKETQVDSGVDIFPVEDLLQLNPDKYQVFVAIGYRKLNLIRKEIYTTFEEAGFSFASFIHPSVKVWPSSEIGKNCFIFENNTLQPFTKVGSNTVLWSGNHVGHHSIIEDHCFISSHVVISGTCTIGESSFLGVNATIHDGVVVGKRNLIGAGAVISRSTPSDALYSPQSTAKHPKRSFEIDF
jgi:sugar O-acyltransferase (sialic acid O-acetyltransferase NeuD family)